MTGSDRMEDRRAMPPEPLDDDQIAHGLVSIIITVAAIIVPVTAFCALALWWW